jgi:DNA-binding MarR family transcriptional regulator
MKRKPRINDCPSGPNGKPTSAAEQDFVLRSSLTSSDPVERELARKRLHLYALDDQETQSRFPELLADRDGLVRQAAAEVLIQVASTTHAVWPIFCDALKTESTRVRAALLAAFVELYSAGSGDHPVLAAALKDADSLVREKAHEMFRELVRTVLRNKHLREIEKSEPWRSLFATHFHPEVASKLMSLLKGRGTGKDHTLWHLQVFLAFARAGSLVKAAKALDLAEHRGVRYHIRALERQLRVKLVHSPADSRRKELKLTDVGADLAGWLGEYLDHFRMAEEC